ncbi:uberolysin/carnocyclin family circular bacteriocin [Clostridium perfringens]
MVMKIATLLGISSTWAMKIVDLIATGASIWAIGAAVAASGGIVAVGIVVLRELVMKKIKQVGYAAAVTY